MPDYYPPPRVVWYVSSATRAARESCCEHLFNRPPSARVASPWSLIKEVVYLRAEVYQRRVATGVGYSTDYLYRAAWVPTVEGATEYVAQEDAVAAALQLDDSLAPAVRSRYAVQP